MKELNNEDIEKINKLNYNEYVTLSNGDTVQCVYDDFENRCVFKCYIRNRIQCHEVDCIEKECYYKLINSNEQYIRN